MVIQNHIRISCLYSHLALEFGKPREESYDEIFVIFPQYKYMLMRNYETYPTNAIWLCGSPNIHLCVHHAIAIPWCCDSISGTANITPGSKGIKEQKQDQEVQKQDQQVQIAEKPKRKVTRPTYLKDYA